MKLLTHADLDAARQLGDEPADRVIAALGSDVWTVNALLRHVHHNGEALPAAVPAAVRAFLEDDAVLPAWADPVRIARAQAWASRHLFHVTVALFGASLPSSYGAAKGARVLVATGRMERATLDRRVNETAQFILDVVAVDGFGPRGAALRAAQKVRLMHAAVRGHLLERGLGEGEVPINQEDLLGTLFTFSAMVVRSVRMLGVEVSDQAADDFQHLWAVVGVLLGIREELLPEGHFASVELGRRIGARQYAASEHGRALTAALLAGMEDHVPAFRSVPRHLVRYLVGDPLADMIGIPADPSFQSKLALMRLVSGPASKPLGAIAANFTALLGRPLLEGVVAAKLRGTTAAFAIPTKLRDASAS